MVTMIDKFHGFAHSVELESVCPNPTIRRVVLKLADVLQYLQNCTSNTELMGPEGGIFHFDADSVKEKLRDVTLLLK